MKADAARGLTRFARLALVVAVCWWVAAFYVFDMRTYLRWIWECRLNDDVGPLACIASYIPLLSFNYDTIFSLRTWRFDILAAPFYWVLLYHVGRWIARGRPGMSR